MVNVQEDVPGNLQAAQVTRYTHSKNHWDYYVPLHKIQSLTPDEMVERKVMNNLSAAEAFISGMGLKGEQFVPVNGLEKVGFLEYFSINVGGEIRVLPAFFFKTLTH